MSQFKFNRRQVFGAATAASALQVGAKILSSNGMVNSTVGRGLLHALQAGEGTAFAQAASVTNAVTQPLAVIDISAKCDGNTLLFAANSAGAVGIGGSGNYTQGTSFPTINLASWFDMYLAPVKNNISVAIGPTDKTIGNAGAGNHEYTSMLKDMGTTGSVTYAVNQSVGALIQLDFSVNATADTSTSVFSQAGQLVTYTTVAAAVNALVGAVKPLQALPKSSGALLTALDDIVTKDTTFASKLAQLGEVLQSTVTPLQTALTASQAKITALAVGDEVNDALIRQANPLLTQLGVAQIMWDAGLTRAVTFAIGNLDVNGGGDFSKPGGKNTNGIQLSAIQKTAMVGQFITAFFQKYPNGVVTFCSDGGRSANGGDANTAVHGIFAKAGSFTTQQWGGELYADMNNFSQSVAVPLTDGSKSSPAQVTVLSTAATLAGCTYGPGGSAYTGLKLT